MKQIRFISNRHWIALILSALLLSIGALIPLFLYPPVCRFYQWTHIPCPTCGGTRCGKFLVEGEFLSALKLQPFLVLLLLSTGFFLLYLGAAALFRWPWPKPRWKFVWITGGILLVINWIYLMLTLR